MNERFKKYLKINIMSFVFIVISFISVTLAWFTYSGLSNVATEVGVKSWQIELSKNGEQVSNDIVISLSEVYPGMDIRKEEVTITNKGDSDAEVKYRIVSARILGDEADNYQIGENIPRSKEVEDIISHDYPFHININLSKNNILQKGGESTFKVSVSWPLDSESNEIDSIWGNKAYQFNQDEELKLQNDSNYQKRPAIQIVISLTAEQYVESSESSDSNYALGTIVLFDPTNNIGCTALGGTCIKTHVIDVNNKVGTAGASTVTLLPDPKSNHTSGTFTDYDTLYNNEISSWTVQTRKLLVSDLLKVVSTDIMDSVLIRNNMSNHIIGNLTFDSRILSEINRATQYDGHYEFINTNFDYLVSSTCYWTSDEYKFELNPTDKGFAYRVIDETYSSIVGENKSSVCNIIPVIIANKSNL